jgi:hypothetical protein
MLTPVREWGAMLAAAALFLSASPALAEPEPEFDVEHVIAQLEHERVVRLPGAVAALDEARVPTNERVVVGPPINADPDAELWIDTLHPVRLWAHDSGIQLTVVRGLWVERGLPGKSFTTTDEPTLRQWLAYQDVTAAVLRTTVPGPEIVPAARLDGLPVTVVRRGVRLVTLPALRPGAPFVDYASGLARRFPGELVVVAYGRWLEFAGPDAERAEVARNITYGESFLDRLPVTEQVARVLDQMDQPSEPVARPVFGSPPPETDVVGISRVVAAIAIVVVAAGWLVALRVRRAAREQADEDEWRLTRTTARAKIEDLGARLLAVESPDPRAAERHATARHLFDQAVTSAAMTEVHDIADEGLTLVEDRP